MVHVLLSGRGGAAEGERGVTLPELVIVIVVVSITALVFAGLFREAARSYELVEREKTLLQEARYATTRITGDLMRVQSPEGIESAGPTSITLVVGDSSRVGYAWSGLKGSELLYTRGDFSRPLAGNVDSLAFSYYTADGKPIPAGRSSPPPELARVSIYLRLARDGQSVELVGSAFLRSGA